MTLMEATWCRIHVIVRPVPATTETCLLGPIVLSSEQDGALEDRLSTYSNSSLLINYLSVKQTKTPAFAMSARLTSAR